MCKEEITKAGYPLGDEDDWLEYVYEAQRIWEIAKDGFTYKREHTPEKRGGWEFVLYTRDNHPAFAE